MCPLRPARTHLFRKPRWPLGHVPEMNPRVACDTCRRNWSEVYPNSAEQYLGQTFKLPLRTVGYDNGGYLRETLRQWLQAFCVSVALFGECVCLSIAWAIGWVSLEWVWVRHILDFSSKGQIQGVFLTVILLKFQCQPVRKFWHLELWWDFLCDPTLRTFSGFRDFKD